MLFFRLFMTTYSLGKIYQCFGLYLILLAKICFTAYALFSDGESDCLETRESSLRYVQCWTVV